jgi:nucleoside-diphosphate-sugar epimerase
MRVLLTGATGFLGRNLEKHLTTFLGEQYRLSGIGSKIYDLRDYRACRKAIQYFNP